MKVNVVVVAPPAFGHRSVAQDGGQRRTAVAYTETSAQRGREEEKGRTSTSGSPGS
jgi:hypothetical protein